MGLSVTGTKCVGIMKGKKMNQPIGAPERLVIIGNGFDLKCGLHSTFGEYIKQVLSLIHI